MMTMMTIIMDNDDNNSGDDDSDGNHDESDSEGQRWRQAHHRLEGNPGKERHPGKVKYAFP